MPDDAYRAPAAGGEAELREKGSRFLAVVAPAADEGGARAVVDELARAHPDATHVCFAWRLGFPPVERASDAGEPHGTAGRPMLRVLQGSTLSDVVAVVVRWFGGVKLGKGGLARAYAESVRQVLGNLPTEERRAIERLELELAYEQLGAVRRLLDPPRVEQIEATYGARVRLTLALWRCERARVREALAAAGIEPARSEPRSRSR